MSTNKLLFISNGHGEDLIACHLVDAFLKQDPQIQVTGIPLVGDGHAYQKRGFLGPLKNPRFPSGGFIRGLKSLVNDLKAGLLAHIFSQYTVIKKLREGASLTLCVGDIFCLVMGASFKHKAIFLPTAKSDLFMPHSRLERWLMKRLASHIFTRDLTTALTLQRYDLPALYLGNPMLDRITLENCEFDIAPEEKVITLLPGSREEAYGNVALMLEVVKAMQTQRPPLRVIIAKAPGLDLDKVQNLCQKTSLNPIITPHFWDSLKAAHLVIGLSGTGNEQAVYVGKTVYCFTGTGPQSTRQRFLEQTKLLGEKLVFLDQPTPNSLAHSIAKALDIVEQPVFNLPQAEASDLIVEAIQPAS